ncbi:BnaAnng28750D [Brassica napus]|uniref:(rape) hypothetical protein n=1 Tax=Brassica napus TaxID=3708 RepID=A0A078JR51_BRANA|nr:unnamed protein product [Brassica napus]CDY68910.1 BnaAnng28750D [Brassica napus]
MMKPTKKPAAPISKPSPGLLTPRVYKPASKTTSLSTSQSLLLQHQSPAKATSIPSCQKENGRPTKSSCLEKRSGSSAIRSSSYGLKSNNTAENKQTKGGNISLSQEADGGLSLAMQVSLSYINGTNVIVHVII